MTTTLFPAATGLQGAGQLVPVREGKTRVVQLDGSEAQVQRVPLRKYIRLAHLCVGAMHLCCGHAQR